jgi:hypothetical protein
LAELEGFLGVIGGKLGVTGFAGGLGLPDVEVGEDAE